MLTRMRIVNIQKHKDLELLLDKINVIVGATDSGKTSVLRALTWALTNDDAGENLINNQGAKSCCVALDADGNMIKRSWSKGKNAYSLNDKEFTTFRTSVPSPIADLLRLDTINIQRRRDLPFMVYFKASDCANQFSEMMDLSEIDNIITNSNRAVKQYSDRVEQIKEAKAKVESELSALSDLDSACAEFSELRRLRKCIKDIETTLTSLKTLQKQHSDATCAFSKVIDPTEASAALQRLETLKKKCVTCNAEALAHEKLLKGWLKAEYAFKCLPDIAEITKELRSLNCHKDDCDDVRTHMEEARRLKYFADIAKEACEKAKLEYEAHREEFERIFPEVCPLCGKVKCND